MTSKASKTEPEPAAAALYDHGDGAEPTRQQLLLQVQAQQAQLQLQAQALAMSSGLVATAKGTDSTSPMDLMPLSAAAVVLGSPQGDGTHQGQANASALDTSLTTASTVPASSSSALTPTTTSTATATATAAAGAMAIRRKSIPLSMKKEAIEWIMGPGKGVPSRAEKHFGALNWDVSASSFRKWWKNRDKIMNDSSSKKRITGGGRKPYLEESEEKLLVIMIQERAKKDRVTRKWIAKTAQHMFQRTNASFKASENWVTKFIRRNGLTLKRSYVTYDHASESAAMMAGGGGMVAAGTGGVGLNGEFPGAPSAGSLTDSGDDQAMALVANAATGTTTASATVPAMGTAGPTAHAVGGEMPLQSAKKQNGRATRASTYV